MHTNTEAAPITGFSIYWQEPGINWFLQEGSTQTSKGWGALDSAMKFDTMDVTHDFLADLGSSRTFIIHDNSLPPPMEPQQACEESASQLRLVNAARVLLEKVGFNYEDPNDPRPYIEELRGALVSFSDSSLSVEQEEINPIESVDRMTVKKTDSLKLQGHQIVGYVLRKDGERIAISAQGAVRWLTDPEYWDLMHPAPVANNHFGLDADYFAKNLKRIQDGINNYTPQEMARALARLARTSDENVAREELKA